MSPKCITVWLCVFLCLGFSSASAKKLNSTLITFDRNTFINNVNQFKTNLDTAQTYLINIYQGAIGGVSAFWFFYSYWLILSVFYYSFAIIYKSTKEDAQKNPNAPGEQRALDFSRIDITSIFNNLRTIKDKNDKVSGDPCYQRTFCQLKQYFSTTFVYKLIPSFILKLLHLKVDPGTNCQSSGCNWQTFLLRIMQ